MAEGVCRISMMCYSSLYIQYNTLWMLAVQHMCSRPLKLLQKGNQMRLDMKLCSRSTKQDIKVSHIKTQIIL